MNLTLDQAQQIITAVSQPITLPSGAVVDVGISLGIAIAPENGAAARPIMAIADRALYASKQGGRGRAFFAEDPRRAPTLSKTPLVGGQWKLKDDGKYDIIVVDNQNAQGLR